MGFEPTNGGFADLSIGPLGYRARFLSIANLHSRKPRQSLQREPHLASRGRLAPHGAGRVPTPSPVPRRQVFCYDA